MEALLKQKDHNDRLADARIAVEQMRRSPVSLGNEKPVSQGTRLAIRQILDADEVVDLLEG